MAGITIVQGLPFVSVTLQANGQTITVSNILLDTGSAASIFRTDDLAVIGVRPEPDDPIRYMTGIGGREAVIEKQITSLTLGELRISPFVVQMGLLDYGLALDGILGMDFSLNSGTFIDLEAMQVGRAG